MKDIAQAIRSFLLAVPEITALVGANITNDNLLQSYDGTTAAITYKTIYEIPHMQLGGSQGLDQAVIQYKAFGSKSGARAEANAVAGLIWQSLDGLQATVGEVEVKGVTRTTGLRFEDDRAEKGTSSYRYITTQDLMFSYYSLATA